MSRAKPTRTLTAGGRVIDDTPTYVLFHKWGRQPEDHVPLPTCWCNPDHIVRKPSMSHRVGRPPKKKVETANV